MTRFVTTELKMNNYVTRMQEVTFIIPLVKNPQILME